MTTSDVTLHPAVVDKPLSTVLACVQLVLVLGVHHLHVPPKIGIAPRAVGALLLSSIDVSSSSVHHHLQSSLELKTTGLTGDDFRVMLVRFVIVQQNLVLGGETTGVTNEQRGHYLLAVLVHVFLVHFLLFESLGAFGTVVGASVDSVDVELFGMVVLVLCMCHPTLTIPLGHPV